MITVNINLDMLHDFRITQKIKPVYHANTNRSNYFDHHQYII